MTGNVYSKLLVPVVQSSCTLKSEHLKRKFPTLPEQPDLHIKSALMPISQPEFIVFWSQNVFQEKDLRQPIRNVMIT